MEKSLLGISRYSFEIISNNITNIQLLVYEFKEVFH